jgi:hypothetical protein
VSLIGLAFSCHSRLVGWIALSADVGAWAPALVAAWQSDVLRAGLAEAGDIGTNAG